jgi:hypothetical protein
MLAGMYQQFQQQVCEQCQNVQLVQESEQLTVHVEPGMQPGVSLGESGEPGRDARKGRGRVYPGRSLVSNRGGGFGE